MQGQISDREREEWYLFARMRCNSDGLLVLDHLFLSTHNCCYDCKKDKAVVGLTDYVFDKMTINQAVDRVRQDFPFIPEHIIKGIKERSIY